MLAPGNGHDESNTKKIIRDEIDKVDSDSSLIKHNGCVACHILLSLPERTGPSEPDVSDDLSEALSHDKLSEEFISLIEKVRMKERMMGAAFAMKIRESKDRHIASDIKEVVEELSRDLMQHGSRGLLRKLFTAFAARQIAQNIGIDYRASAEELYYYMRKSNDAQPINNDFVESVLIGAANG